MKKKSSRQSPKRKKFGGLGHCRIALEMGPPSPWVSRLIAEFADEVIVANPRQLKLIPKAAGTAILWTHKPWRASRE